MIAALLFAQAADAVPPRPPQDWSTLPPVRYVAPPVLSPTLSRFVRQEVAAGRCAAPETPSLTVEFAVLVDAAGRARRTVPRAIGCPTVEQFAAGALSRIVRDNLYPTGALEEQWLRTALTFTWSPRRSPQ